MLAWLPRGRGWVNLWRLPGTMSVEWFDPVRGHAAGGGQVDGGWPRRLSAPWRGQAVVLLRRTV